MHERLPSIIYHKILIPLGQPKLITKAKKLIKKTTVSMNTVIKLTENIWKLIENKYRLEIKILHTKKPKSVES